jgi:hypothetical protein
MVGCDGLNKRGDKEGKKDRFRNKPVSIDQLIRKAEKGQKELPVPLFFGTSISEDPLKIWKERQEQTCFKHQSERRLDHTLFKISKKFIPDTGRGTLLYFIPMSKDGPVGWVIDAKSGSAGMTNNADHPDRVLLKSFIRISDGPYYPSFKIGHPAHIVDKGKVGNAVEKAVDRDVPS